MTPSKSGSRRWPRRRRKAFVAFVMAGDPDYDTALAVIRGLPAAGVDVIEMGMPFTDPMADGPAIQRAGQRALDAGHTMDKTLAMVRAFRAEDDATPIVLMGYYNPIYSRGVPASSKRRRRPGSMASSSWTCHPRRTTSFACPPRPRDWTSSAWRRRRPTTVACRGC